jgi:hypothetical protein
MTTGSAGALLLTAGPAPAFEVPFSLGHPSVTSDVGLPIETNDEANLKLESLDVVVELLAPAPPRATTGLAAWPPPRATGVATFTTEVSRQPRTASREMVASALAGTVHALVRLTCRETVGLCIVKDT